MLGSAFIDEIGSSNNCGDFFDNIEDLLDFPVDEVEGDFFGGGVVNHYDTSVWPRPEPPVEPSTAVFNNTTPELDTGLAIPPYEDFPPMEWFSSFMEDSLSAGSIILNSDTTMNVADNSNHISSNIKSESNEFNQFQTSSPVSVLESSSSCYGGKNSMPLNAESFIRGRARSKRPRPATFNPRPVIQLISPASSITDVATTTTTTGSEILSEIGNHAESRLMMKLAEPGYMSSFKPKKKIKKIKIKKIKMPPFPGSMDHSQSVTPVRKCLHCEITKTPQWRAGPMGPKTLCNACGVRYKSGRLYPEYRPAASPTFVASQHSNSHKKVLEMRIRTCEKMQKPTVEFLPKASHLLDEI
ncbi:hypothetical protein MKW94_022034 [Papaver nudicaule]|uniref:GATA transcription factor n=1 Tax=Papaver nudicaule TaxID=74823 RepID=A0AA41UX56_PAPNU|nr:hypothetical protein [Papaver nudicaule]